MLSYCDEIYSTFSEACLSQRGAYDMATEIYNKILKYTGAVTERTAGVSRTIAAVLGGKPTVQKCRSAG